MVFIIFLKINVKTPMTLPCQTTRFVKLLGYWGFNVHGWLVILVEEDYKFRKPLGTPCHTGNSDTVNIEYLYMIILNFGDQISHTQSWPMANVTWSKRHDGQRDAYVRDKAYTLCGLTWIRGVYIEFYSVYVRHIECYTWNTLVMNME